MRPVWDRKVIWLEQNRIETYIKPSRECPLDHKAQITVKCWWLFGTEVKSLAGTTCRKLWWRELDKTNDDERVDVSGGKSKDDRQVNSPDFIKKVQVGATCTTNNKFKQKKQNEESCPHQACLAEETSLNGTLLDACITYNLYTLFVHLWEADRRKGLGSQEK